jgi:2-methylisocitrate lyase-like PEP mutase family enzyme
MPRTVADKRAAFAALHRSGCFLLPNPWDVGSARYLEHLGFSALATTSTGFAWTTGRPDYVVGRDDALQHLSALSAATDVPLNADFESGFGTTPEAVAESVRLAIGTGIAGLSIEDRIVSDLGVRRVSIGGALALIGWGAVKAAAEEMRAGGFDSLGTGMSGGELNSVFAARR